MRISRGTISLYCSIRCPSYLHQVGVIVLVTRLSTVSERGIFPVEIETVEMILSKKLDRVLDEFSPSAGVGYHRREPARALVPTTDGQQGFQVLVVRFQAGELGVSTFERVNKLVNNNNNFGRFFFPPYTFLDILILVERFQSVVLGEPAESVDQVGA